MADETPVQEVKATEAAASAKVNTFASEAAAWLGNKQHVLFLLAGAAIAVGAYIVL